MPKRTCPHCGASFYVVCPRYKKPPAGAFDRNAYQRDFMRRKRAKDRAFKAIHEAMEREKGKR